MLFTIKFTMPNSPVKLHSSDMVQDLLIMNNEEKDLLTFNNSPVKSSSTLQKLLELSKTGLKSEELQSTDCLSNSFVLPCGQQEFMPSKVNLDLSNNNGDTLSNETLKNIGDADTYFSNPNDTSVLEGTANESSVKFNFSESSESEMEHTVPKIKLKLSSLFGKVKKRKLSTEESEIKTSVRNNKSKSLKIESDLSNDVSNTFDECSFSNSPICEALELRQKNINERDAFLKSLLNDPEFAEAAENVGLFNTKQLKPQSTTKPKIKKRRHTEKSFHFTGYIPTEKRKSLRLQDKEPIYNYNDLIDDTGCSYNRKQRRTDYDDDYTDLEKIVSAPKNKTKLYQSRTSIRTTFLTVDDVTENMIKQIAWKVSEKKYSVAGSSCHQCRQKTMDTKTFCRDKNCIGVRGQFCGVCLKNRYGEYADVALKDPNWRCPVCRGICNCSFCRSKNGKRPTGILAPIAHRTGHKSVKDFLDNLRGEGDYADESKDPGKLLGFSDDLKYAQMGGDIKYFVGFSIDLEQFRHFIDLHENKLFLHLN